MCTIPYLAWLQFGFFSTRTRIPAYRPTPVGCWRWTTTTSMPTFPPTVMTKATTMRKPRDELRVWRGDRRHSSDLTARFQIRGRVWRVRCARAALWHMQCPVWAWLPQPWSTCCCSVQRLVIRGQFHFSEPQCCLCRTPAVPWPAVSLNDYFACACCASLQARPRTAPAGQRVGKMRARWVAARVCLFVFR